MASQEDPVNTTQTQRELATGDWFYEWEHRHASHHGCKGHFSGHSHTQRAAVLPPVVTKFV